MPPRERPDRAHPGAARRKARRVDVPQADAGYVSGFVKNTGKVPHTATADDGSWDSGNLNAGQDFTTPAITQPGTISYKCTYHASLGMVGKIVVTGAATGPAASTSPSASASASPSPTLTGAAQFGISPSPAPTAPPSQKYFPKIAGAVVVLALLGIVLGYMKTARKLADKS